MGAPRRAVHGAGQGYCPVLAAVPVARPTQHLPEHGRDPLEGTNRPLHERRHSVYCGGAWMAETSGWLSRQEVWVDIDAQNATLRPLHTPTGLASLAGEPALELNGTALGDLGSLV